MRAGGGEVSGFKIAFNLSKTSSPIGVSKRKGGTCVAATQNSTAPPAQYFAHLIGGNCSIHLC